MATIIQKKRLTNEVKLLDREPLHYCTAYPDKENPLIWYFILKGQSDTDYKGGEYIGKIVHSPKYPAEPPDYYMLTPSGRYKIGTKICLSNSSYHKGEWSSTWNIKSILIAFYSIWLDDKEYGISHIKDSKENRLKMAEESNEYNKKNNLKIYNDFNFNHLKDFDQVNQKETKTTESNNDNINDNIKIINKNIEFINDKIDKQEKNIQNLEKQINIDK
jgi:ubiquitin-conjugating enzyme E2 J2